MDKDLLLRAVVALERIADSLQPQKNSTPAIPTGQKVFHSGKYKGKYVLDIINSDPEYIVFCAGLPGEWQRLISAEDLRMAKANVEANKKFDYPSQSLPADDDDIPF